MDFGNLLDPVSADAPSGIELRNDPRFHAIERLLEPAGRDNKLKSDGSLDESAEDADWQDVLDQAMALAEDGRDLRLLVILCRAAARSEGFAGLADALRLLVDSLDQHWDTLHPEMRDRDDPKAAALPRTNALHQLENDDNGLLGDLKFGYLFAMPGVGPVAGMDLADAALSEFEYLARSASGLNESEKAAIAAHHAQRVNRVQAASRAFAAEKAEEAAAMIAGLADCRAILTELSDKVAEKAGFGSDPGLSLPELDEFLAHCGQVLEKAQSEMAETKDDSTTPAPASAASDTASAEPPAATPAAAANGTASAQALGVISSRRDVEKSLDAIIAFYERTEPSSPIPHLARRMRRMVPMDFLELMEEIAPSGLKEFGNVAGVDSKKK